MGIEVTKENYGQVRSQNNAQLINNQLNKKSLLTDGERKRQSKEVMDMSDFEAFQPKWENILGEASSSSSGGGGFMGLLSKAVESVPIIGGLLA